METFGRYTLLKLAGQGGMATVHLARQIGPEGFVKPCVLKRISMNHKDDERVRQMFLEEARVSALLNHRNVVHTFDFGEVDGVPFMAMELVDGVNLAQLLRLMAKNGRWIALGPACAIIREVLMGLEYAHALKDLDGHPLHLVHRDVSPQNILMSRSGDVKLADFGIARHDARAQHTQVHAPKGKPGYMAPEQAMGTGMDHRADLFALGIVLVELIGARRVLQQSQSIASVMGVEPRLRELVDLRAEAPEELKAFACRLAALDVDRRPRDAKEAREQLDGIMPLLPKSRTLPEFLKRTFAKYFPVNLAATPEAPSSASLPPVAADVAAVETPSSVDEPATILSPSPRIPSSQTGPMELPPAMDAVGDLQFDEASWAGLPQEQEQEKQEPGSAAVYQGWPSEFEGTSVPALKLPIAQDPTAPSQPSSVMGQVTPFGLVSRSSGVDQMKYFGAEISEEAAKRGKGADVDRPAPPPAVVITGTPTTPAPGVPAKPKKSLSPIVPIVAAGLGIVLVGVLVTKLLLPDGKEGPDETMLGSVRVISEPSGADVLIDGRKIGHVTPTVVKDLEVGKEMRISVRKDRFLTTPAFVKVSIPKSTQTTSANFTLRRGRVFRVESEPEGALVTVNGVAARDITPLSLAPIPFGDSATVTLKLADHIPKKLVLLSNADSATVTSVKLEPGKEIDVVSTPDGADVYLDGEKVGRTPAYDLLVPVSRRFRVALKKPGFRSHRKRISGKTIKGRMYEVTLSPLPLLAMPMSRAEKKRARSMDRQLSKVTSQLKRKRRTLKLAEGNLEAVQGSGTVFIGEIAEAQRKVDDLRAEIVELETTEAELQGELEAFRADIASRIE